MKNIVAITSVSSVGATFVDWSIYFLSGQKKFYNVQQQAWIDVTDNPLTTYNSHGHQKNYPSGLKRSMECVGIFKKTAGDLFTLYPGPLHFDEIDSDAKNLNKTDWQLLIDKRFNDYNQLFKYCNSESIKLIYLGLDPALALYDINTRSLDRMFFESRRATTVEERKLELDQVFFADSIQKWNDLNLTNRWDNRERLALCCRPFDTLNAETERNVDLCYPHLWIDSRLLWHNGKDTIYRIMDYVDLDIIKSKYDHWHSIYLLWQEKHTNALEFVYTYKHIVDSIVNNWFYDIDLTFDQEVIIQHCLIYQHNLNLKTWKLEKFPSNTQDLHKLLEPNTHPIPSIY
jgi:hypothetical protein